MNVHVLSTDPGEAFFEAVSADIGDTLFVTERETFAVVDDNDEPIPFSTRWIGEEAIIELADGNWFSVIGMHNESSSNASTDTASPVSIPLKVKSFNPKDMMSAVRIGGKRLRIGQPYFLESGATILLLATGRLSYDPNGMFDGLDVGETVSDEFSYTISDSEGGFVKETVTVNVSGADLGGVLALAESEEVVLEVEKAFEPLFGTLARLDSNGTISYFEEASFDEAEATQIDLAEDAESACGGDVAINFIQEEEKIERTDVLSPLLGATATLKPDGSIEYTTDSNIAAPVSEGGPVAALSSFLLFPPVLATART